VETTALDQVNLSVAEGEFTSIMGPSGCGKSTLMHILGLIDNLDGGKYWFLGEEVSAYSERQRASLRKENIGFVFQSFNLIDELIVFENVELPLIYTKTPAHVRKTKVEAVLEKMDMAHRKGHFPQQLSGGQQQRVVVARAIVNAPNLILADEPTGNLDSEHGEEVMKILTSLNDEGKTIVMVTHSAEDAAVGKRIIRMLDGKIHQRIEQRRPCTALSGQLGHCVHSGPSLALTFGTTEDRNHAWLWTERSRRRK
jgi:putative ABC transport system ATP-binding protein